MESNRHSGTPDRREGGNSLPEGWQSLVAADCFDQVSTNGIKVKTKDCQEDGAYPVIDQGKEHVSGYIDDPSKLILVDKPLLIFGDHTRIIKWIDFDFVPGADGTKVLASKEFILPRLAYYSMCALEIPDKGYSRHFKFLKELSIPLPPLAEQKVIAEKLDTLLAQVDTTKARLERIPDIIKRFRQSVLAAAVSGKLTEEWREDRSFNKVSGFNEWNWQEIPSSWCVKTYPELVESRLGKMLDKSKNTGDEIPYLGNINVRWFGFDLSSLQVIKISSSEKEELSLKHGDVLICEGGEPGRCAIWKEELEYSITFQKALHRARVNSEILPDWLCFNLKNDADNLTLSQLFTGSTIKHLTGKALTRYPIRVPPIDEQTEIVRRVEELFAFADTIEQKATAALERVNNLTQSILAKAFRGKLTADWRAANPDLISGDNSAEALLAKIQAEREALALEKKAAKNPRKKKD